MQFTAQAVAFFHFTIKMEENYHFDTQILRSKPDGMMRFSVGVENVDDLIVDIALMPGH